MNNVKIVVWGHLISFHTQWVFFSLKDLNLNHRYCYKPCLILFSTSPFRCCHPILCITPIICVSFLTTSINLRFFLIHALSLFYPWPNHLNLAPFTLSPNQLHPEQSLWYTLSLCIFHSLLLLLIHFEIQIINEMSYMSKGSITLQSHKGDSPAILETWNLSVMHFLII